MDKWVLFIGGVVMMIGGFLHQFESATTVGLGLFWMGLAVGVKEYIKKAKDKNDS